MLRRGVPAVPNALVQRADEDADSLVTRNGTDLAANRLAGVLTAIF